MFFRIIFYSVLFYFIIRILRVISNLFTGVAQKPNSGKKREEPKHKVYSKDEIEEAEYEEIK